MSKISKRYASPTLLGGVYLLVPYEKKINRTISNIDSIQNDITYTFQKNNINQKSCGI